MIQVNGRIFLASGLSSSLLWSGSARNRAARASSGPWGKPIHLRGWGTMPRRVAPGVASRSLCHPSSSRRSLINRWEGLT